MKYSDAVGTYLQLEILAILFAITFGIRVNVTLSILFVILFSNRVANLLVILFFITPGVFFVNRDQVAGQQASQRFQGALSFDPALLPIAVTTYARGLAKVRNNAFLLSIGCRKRCRRHYLCLQGGSPYLLLNNVLNIGIVILIQANMTYVATISTSGR